MEGEREAGGGGQLQDERCGNPATVGAGELMTDVLQAGELRGNHRADGKDDRDHAQLAAIWRVDGSSTDSVLMAWAVI